MAARRARRAAGGGFGEGGGMRRSGSDTRAQTVYVLQKDKKLKPVSVRTGITDGSSTEVVSGDLHEGAEVIVGIPSDGAKGKAQQKKGLRFGF
jgi:HlyD family secretion protein